VFLIGAISYITYIISAHKGFDKDFFNIWRSLVNTSTPHLFIVTILMFFNWFFEAIKWKLLSAPLQNISILKAYKAVISGVSFSFITIGGVGDYLGRALHSIEKDQKALVGITLAGGVYQNLITYTAGGAGFIFFINEVSFQLNVLLWSILLFLFLAILFFIFNAHLLAKYKKLYRFVNALKFHSNKQKISILLLSLGRYTIILVQYYLILLALNVQLNFADFITGISLMLLLKSVIPRFSFLSDLSIREFSALLFFSKVGLNPAIIVSSTLLLWLLNVLIPSVVGLYFITSQKISIRKNT
jgi:hypothetical protein